MHPDSAGIAARRPALNSLLVADLCPTRTALESRQEVAPDPAAPGESLAKEAAATVRRTAAQAFPHATPIIGGDNERLFATAAALHDPDSTALQHAVMDLDGYRVEVPFLERAPSGAWRAFIVSTSSGDDLEDEHLTAAGVLTAFEHQAAPVDRIHVLHLNRDYRRPPAGAASVRPPDPLDGPEAPPRTWPGLLHRTDVTRAARALQPQVEALRDLAFRRRTAETIPRSEIGAQCTKRGTCRFSAYCQLQEQRAGVAYPLRLLPRLSPKLKAALQHAGHHDAATIPLNFVGPKDPAFPKRKPAALTELQQTWARAYANDGWALDPEVLAHQFATATMPVTFLDYETVKLVDGLVEGDKPNAEHAVSFRALTLTPDGQLHPAGHVALAATPEAELIPRVHAAVGDTGTIFGYGAAEQTFTRGLIEKNPDYAEILEAQRLRIQDQNAVWGKGIAHAALKGKTGAKNVAKALGGPEDQYPADGIQNGTEVQSVWLKARDPLLPPTERDALVARIQAYNDHDVRVQLRLFTWQMAAARLATAPPPFVHDAVTALERAGIDVPDFRVHLAPRAASAQVATETRAQETASDVPAALQVARDATARPSAPLSPLAPSSPRPTRTPPTGHAGGIARM